jgi:hypothetical protein
MFVEVLIYPSIDNTQPIGVGTNSSIPIVTISSINQTSFSLSVTKLVEYNSQNEIMQVLSSLLALSISLQKIPIHVNY